MEPKLIQQYNEMKMVILAINDDVQKSVIGNKAAGTRARIKLMEIKNLAHEMRKTIVSKK